jgi:RES domain-containing protein
MGRVELPREVGSGHLNTLLADDLRVSRTLLCNIGGSFFRTIPLDRIDHVLDPPAPTSAGRYHRHGQPALYMSPSLDWARAAVSGYMREDMKPRFVVPLEVEEAQVFDQRNLNACREFGIDRSLSNMPWRSAIRNGQQPNSWQVSDRVRESNADGLIDVSRHIPKGWHLVLFKWNDLGGPKVRVSGDPQTVYPDHDGPKWG